MGSAANALIDRLPRGEKWGKGRSHCDKCGHELGIRDLIPIISYVGLLFNKFKIQNSNFKSNSKFKSMKPRIYEAGCRYCHSPIPFRNFVMEIVMAMGFYAIFNQFSNSPIFNVIILLGIFWVTSIIAVMDWETKLVSETLVVVWGGLVVAMQVINPLLLQIQNLNDKFTNQIQNIQIQNNIWGLVAGIVLIGGLWAVSRGKAMGFGDVEIAVVAGWWLGWPETGVALWTAFVSGAIVGLVKLCLRQAKLKSEIPFGPFLIAGTWTAYFWGGTILNIFNF